MSQPNTKSIAVWARISGAVRSRRSTNVNSVPVSTVSAAKASCPTSVLQLRAKQKLKGYYGTITEKQFRHDLCRSCPSKRGDTGENLVGLLESRLDAIIYRAKFVPTVFAARQFVNHGHVNVNGRRVNIPSYRCKPGDVIEVREKSKQLALVIEASQLAERDVPDYVEADHDKMTATYTRVPELGEMPYAVQMEPNLVVEFYSR